MGSEQFDKAGILKVDFSALEAKSKEFEVGYPILSAKALELY